MTDWSQIVQQHGPLVWTTVYRLLRHDADAADCFHPSVAGQNKLGEGTWVNNPDK